MIRMVISIIIIRVMIRMMRVMSIYLMTEQEGIIATTGMLKPVVLQDDNEIINQQCMHGSHGDDNDKYNIGDDNDDGDDDDDDDDDDDGDDDTTGP